MRQIQTLPAISHQSGATSLRLSKNDFTRGRRLANDLALSINPRLVSGICLPGPKREASSKKEPKLNQNKGNKMLKAVMTLAVAASLAIFAGCSSPPKTFHQNRDELSIWKTIELRDGVNDDEAWKTLVDTLSQKYDLEVVQKDGGYLRSSWKFTYMEGDQVVDRYRSRIMAKLTGSPWNQIKVKCESQWQGNHGWTEGYDTMVLEDVYGDIQGKLGRTRR
jgi:hypothetical protein